MTDLNEFRAALRAPDPDQRSLDIAQIMTKGARVRRRRRLAVGATSGLAVVALLVGGSQIAELGVPRSDGPGISIGAPGPVRPEIDGQLGEVIDTGIPAVKGTWVLYGNKVEGMSDTSFGVTLGRRLTTGALTAEVMSNEAEGSDRAPGFHAVSGPMGLDAGTTPMFGYYVGAPALITGTVGRRRITATLAVWSEDQSVVVFWFDPKDVPSNGKIKNLAAYDGTGNELPVGNASIGVG